MKQSGISQVLEKYAHENQEIEEFDKINLFLFGKDKEYEIDIANDLNTKTEAYQLIYRLYKKMGYANDDATLMWYSIFNALPNTTTLVVRSLLTKKVVATLSIVIDGTLGLPLEEYYPEQMKTFRSKNRLCAEIISLGFDESIQGSSDTLLQMFKFAYLIANSVYHATDFLIKIKPNHAFFYMKKLLFQPLGAEVNCSKMNNGRARLYHLDLLEAQKQSSQNNNPNINYLEVYQSCITAQNCQELIETLKEKISIAEMTILELDYFFKYKKEIFINVEPKILIKISKMYKNIETELYLKDLAHSHFDCCQLV